MRPFDPRLMKYAKETRAYIALLVIIGFVMTLLIALQVILLAKAVSIIFYRQGQLEDILWLVVAVGGIFLGRAVIHFVQNAAGHRAALRVISALRAKVLKHSGNLGPRWLAAGNSAKVATVTTRGLDALEAYFVSFLPQFFLSFTAMPALIFLIWWLDWVSAALIIFCIPLIPIFMILIGKMTANYSNQRLKAMQDLGSQLLDLIAGLTTLKSLGREQGPKARVKALGDSFAEKTMQTLYVAFLSGAALEFLATLSTALVAVEVGFRMVHGNLLLFEGLVIIMLTPEVFKPLREVGTQFHASADGVAAAAEVFEILETPLPETQTAQADIPEKLNLRNSVIEFRDLSAYAPGRATVAPNELNAKINPGEITVLRGVSGSGKSTTVQILLKLLQPDSGEVLVNGKNLSEIPAEAWWNEITWVPQRPAIVPGTIAENLGLTEDEEHSPEFIQACIYTGFAEVLNSIPNGVKARVGHGGIGLSVGQRQRLALTRALLRPTQLIILDEPSAHLDASSERHISNTVKALRDSGRTVIVIAHRAAITKIADQVIHVESGTRDISKELAEKERAAAELSATTRQFAKDEDYALPASWKKGGEN
ncbi:MAG: thiol reductant ABC exporter subunit CydD [Arcanobacterium sp.]|nr:thiol reductant ABC exporter subunit CydD [Arcanobacterium sp.]